MKHSETVVDTPKKGAQFSLGFVVVVILLAFLAGNRLTFIGDWFFGPYNTNNNHSLPRQLNYEEVKEVYSQLKKRYDGKLKIEDLQAGLSKGLVNSVGDPYTTYLTAKEAEEFQDDLNGQFSGIGIEIGRRNDKIVVISPVSGSPAAKAGLKAGDIIASINDKPATGLSTDEAASKIRGQVGTKVKLDIIRDGNSVGYTIVRKEIIVKSVESEIIDNQIGYIKISRFGDDTAELVADTAQTFKSKNIKKIILDVRNNGGGLLDSPVEIAGLWLDEKLVAEQKTGGKTVSRLQTRNNPTLAGTELVILINEGSASASEILAGALHDHGIAKLIGETTFGKGSVQELIELKNGAKLKVTTARWYTPKGKNIDKSGIKPDIEVELSAKDSNAGRDPQKARAIAELNK